MKKLYVYSRFEDQCPLYPDHSELEPTVSAILEYYLKRCEVVGPMASVTMTISFDEDLSNAEYIWDEDDIESALDALIKERTQPNHER